MPRCDNTIKRDLLFCIASQYLNMASLVVMLKMALLVCFAFHHANGEGLEVGYYKEKCPNLESIVKEVVYGVIHEDPTLAASLMRIHFHDCFVRVSPCIIRRFY